MPVKYSLAFHPKSNVMSSYNLYVIFETLVFLRLGLNEGHTRQTDRQIKSPSRKTNKFFLPTGKMGSTCLQ
jgi:hypothetical protein